MAAEAALRAAEIHLLRLVKLSPAMVVHRYLVADIGHVMVRFPTGELGELQRVHVQIERLFEAALGVPNVAFEIDR